MPTERHAGMHYAIQEAEYKLTISMRVSDRSSARLWPAVSIVRKDIVRKDIVRKDIVRKDIVRKDIVRKYIVRKESRSRSGRQVLQRRYWD